MSFSRAQSNSRQGMMTPSAPQGETMISSTAQPEHIGLGFELGLGSVSNINEEHYFDPTALHDDDDVPDIYKQGCVVHYSLFISLLVWILISSLISHLSSLISHLVRRTKHAHDLFGCIMCV